MILNTLSQRYVFLLLHDNDKKIQDIFSLTRLSNHSKLIPFFLRTHSRAYDFQSIVTASSLIYGFASCVPLGIWFILRQLGINLKIVTCVSLYGYSLFVFLPATVSIMVTDNRFWFGEPSAITDNEI